MFDDNETLKDFTGENQIEAENPEEEAALEGDYGYEAEAKPEEMMNAQEDLEEADELFLDEEAMLIQTIIANCEGVDEVGNPKCAGVVSVETINPEFNTVQELGKYAFYKPIITFHHRFEYTEIVMTFVTSKDAELRAMWNHLQTFGKILDGITKSSTEAPHLSLILVPMTGYGCYYAMAENPIFWQLQSPAPNEPVTQIKMCFENNAVNFYQTDEVRMREIEASVQRARQDTQRDRDNAVEMQRRKDEEKRAYNARAEQMRRL